MLIVTLEAAPACRQAKEPELRALEQIVAEAAAAGRDVVVLGPAGILEITENRTTESTEVTEHGIGEL